MLVETLTKKLGCGPPYIFFGSLDFFFNFKCTKKCPYSELFWSVFSRIRTEYGEIRSIRVFMISSGGVKKT